MSLQSLPLDALEHIVSCLDLKSRLSMELLNKFFMKLGRGSMLPTHIDLSDYPNESVVNDEDGDEQKHALTKIPMHILYRVNKRAGDVNSIRIVNRTLHASDVSKCFDFSDFKNLKILHVAGWQSDTHDPNINNLGTTLKLFSVCPQLTTLELVHCDLAYFAHDVLTRRLDFVSALGAMDLKELRVDYASALSSDMLISVLRQLPHLQVLSCQGCDLSYEVMEVLGQSCLDLRLLDLSDANMHTRHSYIPCLYALTRLETLLTTEFSRAETEIAALNGLSSTVTTLSFKLSQCPDMKVVATSLLNFPKLEYLNLVDCTGVREDSFPSGFALPTTLKQLCLPGRGIWTTLGFLVNCDSLQQLEITNCNSLKLEMFHTLSTMNNLQDLRLDGCKGIPYSGLMALATAGTHIARLSVNACLQLSPQAISAIAKFPHLEAVMMNQCRGLKMRDMKPLLQCPDKSGIRSFLEIGVYGIDCYENVDIAVLQAFLDRDFIHCEERATVLDEDFVNMKLLKL